MGSNTECCYKAAYERDHAIVADWVDLKGEVSRLRAALAAERQQRAQAEANLDEVKHALEVGGITSAGASFDSPADAVIQTIHQLRHTERERDTMKAEVENLKAEIQLITAPAESTAGMFHQCQVDLEQARARIADLETALTGLREDVIDSRSQTDDPDAKHRLAYVAIRIHTILNTARIGKED